MRRATWRLAVAVGEGFVEDAVGDFVLGEEAEGLGAAFAVYEDDAVGVGAEAAAWVGDVVGGDEV